MTQEMTFPFTKEDIINAVNKHPRASVDIRSSWVGGKHHHFYVAIGNKQFSDNGKYQYAYQFAVVVQKLFAEIEKELAKDNIVLTRKECWLESGWDYVWRSVKTTDLMCVEEIVKIVPCAEFKELQEWLKKNANFNLGVADLYTCDVCQKRSDKSYSNFYYFAADENYCKKLLERTKAECKGSAKIDEDEYIDNDPFRYEYEQYGRKCTSLQF